MPYLTFQLVCLRVFLIINNQKRVLNFCCKLVFPLIFLFLINGITIIHPVHKPKRRRNHSVPFSFPTHLISPMSTSCQFHLQHTTRIGPLRVTSLGTTHHLVLVTRPSSCFHSHSCPIWSPYSGQHGLRNMSVSSYHSAARNVNDSQFTVR